MLANLDRLKVFHHVFTSGSIVAAANVLHVSQSAVSQTIQKLEKELDTQLFTRLHKQLIPTAAGNRLHEVVQPFMSDLGGYLKELETAKNYPAGELRVGAPPEFGKAYLPSIVADFREQYPDVTFTLKLGTPEKMLPMLRKGEVDFALVDVFLTQSTHIGHLDMYHFDPVVEEEVILACSSRYHDRHLHGDFSCSTLSRQNFISYRKDLETVRQWFRHHFSKAAIQARTVLTVDSHAAVISAIMNNIGMGVVASHLIRDRISQGAIIQITTPRPEIINPISIVHLQDKIPTFTEKVFENYMVDKIRGQISDNHDGMKVLRH